MISVIVPAYNAAGTIKHCLNSLLNQDFVDYEIIVTDDGSNDSTGDICKKYMREQKNIRYIRQENAGPSAARNNGTRNAKGEYLRHSSPTFKQWRGYELSAENHRALYVPRGFAHGFASLEDGTIMMYQCDGAYDSKTDTGIIFNDLDIGVIWPVADSIAIHSARDLKLMKVKDFRGFIF